MNADTEFFLFVRRDAGGTPDNHVVGVDATCSDHITECRPGAVAYRVTGGHD